jgi:hypothetical protein
MLLLPEDVTTEDAFYCELLAVYTSMLSRSVYNPLTLAPGRYRNPVAVFIEASCILQATFSNIFVNGPKHCFFKM